MRSMHESIMWIDGHAYVVCFEREAFGGYTAHFPAIPALKPYGETYDEAQQRAIAAIERYAEQLERRGEPLPATDLPVRGRGQQKKLRLGGATLERIQSQRC